MYGYIYLITNKINNKKYIGQRTADFDQDSSYLGSGTLIKKAVQKYGTENFEKEMLEECKSKEELDEKEKFWISKFNAVENEEFYNLANGANGSAKGSKRSEETRRRLSESQIGKTISDEQKKQISKTVSSQMWVNNGQIETKATKETLDEFLNNGFVLGRLKFTEETRKNMGLAQKGRITSENTKELLRQANKGKNNGFYGKKHTEESKRIMSERAKNRTVSDETKRLLTSQRLGRRWINNGLINKFVKPETLDSYLSNGWSLGIIH